MQIRLSQSQLEQIRTLLNEALDAADAEIVSDIRRNDGKRGSRENLLSQLDVLETVRERLNVRIDSRNQYPSGDSDV